MADSLTPGPVPVPVSVMMRIFIITDAAGNGPFLDDTVVTSDVAIASSIWQQAGVTLLSEPVNMWQAPEFVDIEGDELAAVRAHDWDPGQAHVDVYYSEATDNGAGSSPLPWQDVAHAIHLTDQEEEQPHNAASWRGVALAHEFGHYLGLLHTHASDPADDPTHTDHCDDTDIADSRNLMTQGSRGRSSKAEEIHLTADQIARARSYLFGSWPNVVADIITSVLD